MSLASERREAEQEKANYAKAVKAMRKAGGTFSGGSQPGTFTMNGKTVVGDAQSGIYDLASLKKAARGNEGGVNVTVNGVPMTYYDEAYRNNPGITWKGGDQAGGFANLQEMNLAHPQTMDWVEQWGPAIVGGIAGLGLLAGPALAGGGAAAGGGELLSGMDLAADAAVGSGNYIGGGAAAGAGGGGFGSMGALNPLGGAPGAGGGLSTLNTITAGGATPWGLTTSGLGELAGVGGAVGSAVGPIAQGAGLGGAAGGASTGLLSALGLGGLEKLTGGGNNLLGGLATGIGGYLASDSMGDAYRDVSNQFMNIGAPYRDRLNASYQPGFDLWQQPGYAGAFDQSADAAARAVSAKSGNPFGNPGAMGEIQETLMNRAYLPALSNYRGQLGQFGGMGLNTAGAGSMAGANAEGGGWEAIGAGANQIFNPQPNIGDLFKQYGLGGNNQYAMNIGGMRQ